VITAGTVRAGDPIEVIHRPPHGVTVRDVFTAAQQDARRLQRLLDEAENLAPKTADKVRAGLAAQSRAASQTAGSSPSSGPVGAPG
jgi:MOSC domain-containing protein YiiM